MKSNCLRKKRTQEFIRVIKESLILFNNQYYKQTDGVAMGSPLGPTLALTP